TVEGVRYKIRFWVSAPSPLAGHNEIDVLWNGQTVLEIEDLATITGSDVFYHEKVVEVVGTGEPAELRLRLQTAQQFHLDDIEVTAIPGADHAAGTLDFTDPDLNEVRTVSVAENGSDYVGQLVAQVTDSGEGDGQGRVTWTFSVDDAAIQHLGEEDIITQTYTVTVSDGNGGTGTQTVTITIRGTNDDPVITFNGGGSEASVAIDENTVAVTTVTSTDVDGGAPTYALL